ncbi:MAG TPA: hypothetical protein VL651_11815 [Bacteroidia bacterium]|jgi:hypothetical protein|nr:hypothetical protein [Bacteroidia bacterium]
MKHLEEFSKSDYASIAKDIAGMTSKSEDELFTVIGHGLNDSGLKASDKNNVLFERVDRIAGKVSAKKAFNFVAATDPLDHDEAQRKGKVFWKKFKEKVRSIICDNKALSDVIEGNGTLEDKLKVIIPVVLAALGMAAINPTLLLVISAALAIIAKAGFEAYCDI